jgi:acyl-CoA synthetase (NDP forming)
MLPERLHRLIGGGDRDRAFPISRYNEQGWLGPLTVSALLEMCGIPAPQTRVVVNAAGVLAAAHQLGYPVVLKGVGPSLVHKTEAGAVYLDLQNDDEVLSAHHALARRPDVHSVLVQPMVKSGVEMFIGVAVDTSLGPLMMCGSGRTMMEAKRDAAYRFAPLTERTAREMLEETDACSRLQAFPGGWRRDNGGFLDILLRTSAIVGACPEIVELEFDPVIVTSGGAIVVDARIRVASRAPSAAG